MAENEETKPKPANTLGILLAIAAGTFLVLVILLIVYAIQFMLIAIARNF